MSGWIRHLVAAGVAVPTALAGSAPARAELTLDTSFGNNGIAWTDFLGNSSDRARALLIQPDGKILTVGYSETSGGQYVAISRHTADGIPDSTGFDGDGKLALHWVFRDAASDIDLQEDGKIVAAGMQMTSTGVSTQRPTLYRFLADGTVDSLFGADGRVALGPSFGVGENGGMRILPDGRILTGGPHHGNTGPAFHSRRYLSDGTVEAGDYREFGIDYNRGACAFPVEGGMVLANLAAIGGRREFVMARVDSTLAPVVGFGVNGIVHTGIEAAFGTELKVIVLPDGKILLAGSTPRVTGNTQWTVLRFHADGSLDSTFGLGGRTDLRFAGDGTNENCYDATVDAEGRILLVGEASTPGTGVGIARLLADGAPDSTFSDDGLFAANLNGNAGGHYLTCVQLLPGGKILAAGYDGVSRGGDFFLVEFLCADATGIDVAEPSSTRLSLSTRPNPSNGSATVSFQLQREQPVQVEIFDLAGRVVRRLFDGALSPGAHAVPWDGRDKTGREAPAGVYFTRVSSPRAAQTAKLILLR